MVQLIHVVSSNIAAIGYDERSHTLVVRFHSSGRLYGYRGVPVTVYQSFLAAASKGRFFAHFIRGRYPYGLVA